VIRVEVPKHLPGTAWVVDAAKAATADTGGPLWVDPKSATSGVLDELRKAGVKLREVTPVERTAGCQAFQRDVVEGRLKHLGAGSLTDAVRMAEARPSGEAFVFSARKASGDVSPLDAVVLASMAARVGAEPFFVY
jgi:hypothetical protein